jgi:hypothetical protein
VRVRPAFAGEGRYFVRVPEGANKERFVFDDGNNLRDGLSVGESRRCRCSTADAVGWVLAQRTPGCDLQRAFMYTLRSGCSHKVHSTKLFEVDSAATALQTTCLMVCTSASISVRASAATHVPLAVICVPNACSTCVLGAADEAYDKQEQPEDDEDTEDLRVSL